MALLDDIGSLLVTASVVTVDWPLFKGHVPTSPDNLVAVFEYAGNPLDIVWAGERPSVQVRVRSKGYQSGQSKASAALSALHGVSEQVVNGKRYLLILARQSVTHDGKDENDRDEFVVNFDVIKER